MSIRCIIVDDEPIAARGIAGYAEKVSFLEVAAIFNSALELNDFLRKESADVVFLDIEMPYLTGINWLRSVKNPPKIIFTTAYDRYAIEGFELDIVDYLLKPVSFDRFLKAANKIQSLFDQTGDHIFVKTEGRLEKVFYKQITHVEGMQNYVVFHVDEKKLISHLTLKAVEEQLPGSLFLKTHKSYIVNKAEVRSIEGLRITLTNEVTIPIGKTQKNEVYSHITSHKILRK